LGRILRSLPLRNEESELHGIPILRSLRRISGHRLQPLRRGTLRPLRQQQMYSQEQATPSTLPCILYSTRPKTASGLDDPAGFDIDRPIPVLPSTTNEPVTLDGLCGQLQPDLQWFLKCLAPLWHKNTCCVLRNEISYQ
jgi:hypothetical protein